MHSETIQVRVGELAVGALVHLGRRDSSGDGEKEEGVKNKPTEG